MAGQDLGQRLRRVPLVGGVLRTWDNRLTLRGRYLLVCLGVFALVGLDTRRTQVYLLFAAAAGIFAASLLFAMRLKPRVKLECVLPLRATAGTPVELHARVTPLRRAGSELVLELPFAPEARDLLKVEPARAVLPAQREIREVRARLVPQRRGRYRLRGLRARRTDPLRLMTTLPERTEDQTLLVYPRFWHMDELDIPAGRRYQPGGIPLASSTGDAIEFVGTRDYREGDPIKNIHWRSWARRGAPVVKEYQEEYFSRVAMILDTYLPPNATPEDRASFEDAISTVASIADWFSRGEAVVDILAAGPDLYEVSAGRSLAYLENILDVLACIEPCHEPPFTTVGPPLFDKLARLTTVVAVMLDWDDAREAFVRRVREQGTAVRGIIVRAGATTKPWSAAAELGHFSQTTPEDVRKALAASAARATA